MTSNKEKVTYVRFVFSANDDLFARVTDLDSSSCDISKSIEAYIHSCEDKIRQTYPNVGDNIEVINIDDDMNAGDTYVQVWDDFDEGALSLREREVVIEICERIFDQRDWYRWKAFVLIIEAERQIKIPASIIRWVCAKRFVDTNKSATLWRISSDEIDRISRQVKFFTDVEQIKNLTGIEIPIACYWEDTKGVSIETFPENIDLLIVSKAGFDELLASNASLLTLKRKYDRVNILAEHFINVANWSLWDCLYPKAVAALQKQAKRKDIDCELQLPDAIAFSRSVEISQALTLQQCVEELLQPLSRVISDAKSSLAGGLIWDEIYEQKGQEIRFQNEILHPLLLNMGYNLVWPTHGNRGEHGRDFVFYEETKFGDRIYYALQAKSGNVSGGANRDIDELLIQIDRALSMPFRTLSEESEIYISIMIIATSGEFTKDAKEVIREKIPKYITKGAVYFWGKNEIKSLISRFHRRKEID